MPAAAENPAFQAGLDCLESGFYWEAHEILEPVWMNAPADAPERFMVQALIQLANAALKQVMDRPLQRHARGIDVGLDGVVAEPRIAQVRVPGEVIVEPAVGERRGRVVQR